MVDSSSFAGAVIVPPRATLSDLQTEGTNWIGAEGMFPGRMDKELTIAGDDEILQRRSSNGRMDSCSSDLLSYFLGGIFAVGLGRS